MEYHQIYGAIEFRDDSLKILIGKFCDNRLNILYRDEETVSGKVGSDVVLASLSALVKRSEEALGVAIKAIILSFSAMKTKVVTHREVFNYPFPTPVDKRLVREIYAQFYQQEVPGYYVFGLTNLRYSHQGLVSLKPPYQENVSSLEVTADLLLGEVEVVDEYLSLFKKLGIEVLDLGFDALAIMEESSILRQSDSVYNVLVDIQADITYFHLFDKSTYSGSGFIEQGYNCLLEKIQEHYPLDLGVIKSLVAKFVHFQEAGNNNDPIYGFHDGEQERVITRRKLYHLLQEPLQQLVSTINEQCADIIRMDRTTLILVQEFVDFVGTRDLLTRFDTQCSMYLPSSLGVRQGKWTNLLGQLYLWNEQQSISEQRRSIVDDQQMTEKIMKYQQEPKVDSLIQKLKNISLI